MLHIAKSLNVFENAPEYNNNNIIITTNKIGGYDYIGINKYFCLVIKNSNKDIKIN